MQNGEAIKIGLHTPRYILKSKLKTIHWSVSIIFALKGAVKFDIILRCTYYEYSTSFSVFPCNLYIKCDPQTNELYDDH